MYQRAYRQRKDSSLEESRKRVSELTNTVELMTKAFLECHDRLGACGLPEKQLQDIRESSMQYAAFMKVEHNPGEESPTTFMESLHRASTSSSKFSVPATLSAEKTLPLWLDYSAASQSLQQKDAGPIEIDLGYTMYVQEAEEVPQQVDYFNFDRQAQVVVPASHKQQQLTNQQPTTYYIFRAVVPENIELLLELPPPMTYSFYETSFARRLHRASLEAGYQLLLDPARRIHTYDRVFKLSLMTRERAKLAAAFKTTLDGGSHEVLGFWSSPLVHVGGAGTHYPYRDRYGNLQPRQTSYNVGLVGPQTLALLDNAVRDNISADMTVEIAGFEGEWFDPYDVEGYLEEKSISIDPTSSFVEVEIIEYPPTPESISMSSKAMPQTPRGLAGFSTQDRAASSNLEQLQVLEHIQANPNQWNDLFNTNFSGVGYPDATLGSWTNPIGLAQSGKQYQQPTALQSQPMPWEGSGPSEYLQDQIISIDTQIGRQVPTYRHSAMPRPRKKVVTVDVAKFVEGAQIVLASFGCAEADIM